MPSVIGQSAAVARNAGLAGEAGYGLRRPERQLLTAATVLALLVLLALMAHSAVTGDRGGRAAHEPLALPGALTSAASISIGSSDHRFWVRRGGAALTSRGGAIGAAFTPSGATLSVASGTVSLALAGVGRDGRLLRVGASSPAAAANRVHYRHGPVGETYENGPFGLEQRFSVNRRPARGAGPLLLSLRVGGSLIARQDGRQITFGAGARESALRYGQLSAVDATGRRLPSVMRLRDGTLQLRIDDRGAHYPLAIDPFIQQGAKLTGGTGAFGSSVALSADGSTALIGSPCDGEGCVGAAFVFTRSGAVWTRQGEKLTGIEEKGAGEFGSSVALSSDGNTALVGGIEDNNKAGAAWVFTRSGSTWAPQGKKLTGEGGEAGDEFGWAVALSGDGNTAAVGGPKHKHPYGAAWMFTRSGGTWSPQEKIVGSFDPENGNFGSSIALSADGETLLIGGTLDEISEGAAWVFTRPEGKWIEQVELNGTGEVGSGWFGSSVALSSDGNTALVGGYRDNEGAGAAWVFTRAGTNWTQQGGKLVGGGEIGKGEFGTSVALSSDGATALIGAGEDSEETGAAWAFTRAGTTWTQQGGKLTGGGEEGNGEEGEPELNGKFGRSVALSADAATALIGGPEDGGVGAAWVFANGEPPPAPGSTGGPPPTPPASIVPTAHITAAQIAALLAGQLLPGGKNARIKALLKHGGFSVKVRALEAGSLTLAWYSPARGAKLAKRTRPKPVLVASAHHTFSGPAAATIKIKLTAAGRKLLRRARRVKLTGRGTFTPLGGPGVSAARAFVLKR